MGAWSHEPFGNDDANDWAYGLEGKRDLSFIEETFDKTLDVDDYLGASDGSEVIAAAEVLAKLIGKGTQTDSYTKKVDEWIRTISVKPGPELLAKARRALERVVGENSELCELWEEGGSDAWRSSVKALQKAIGT